MASNTRCHRIHHTKWAVIIRQEIPMRTLKGGVREVFYSMAIKRILELMYRKGKTQQAKSIKVRSVKKLRIG